MPTLSPTLPLLGRIRAGDRSGRNNAPKRLDHFRLTSDNKPRLEYAVKLGWGEEVIEWPDAPEGRQWQMYGTMDSLTVVVPKIAAFSQYDELWSGAECIYRCDGTSILKTQPHKDYPGLGEVGGIQEGMPCVCEQFSERVPTVTRVSLFLPELPGVGVWRLDTRGFYAGTELQGIVGMLEEASRRGMYIEADLGISQRKRRSNGQTRIFPVPTLQPRELTMGQILQLRQPQAAPALTPSPIAETIAELSGKPVTQMDVFEQTVRQEAKEAAQNQAQADEQHGDGDRVSLTIAFGRIREAANMTLMDRWLQSQFGRVDIEKASDEILRNAIKHFVKYGHEEDAFTRDLD
ncbi:MAG: hypothetical protein ACR2QC_08110 [Gammaproteobacteria bacterium]